MVRRRGPRLTAAQKAELWRRWRQGESLNAIGRALGRIPKMVHYIVAGAGGIPPVSRQRARQALTLSEREAISRGVARGVSLRQISRELGRVPSTVSREVQRHGGRRRYRAAAADRRAWACGRRPKRCRLALHPALRDAVAAKLALEWAPQQIAGWLRQAYPTDPTMRVSHETIYLSLFVQSRGVLKKALMAHLRQRRIYRRPKVAAAHPGGHIVDAVSKPMIAVSHPPQRAISFQDTSYGRLSYSRPKSGDIAVLSPHPPVIGPHAQADRAVVIIGFTDRGSLDFAASVVGQNFRSRRVAGRLLIRHPQDTEGRTPPVETGVGLPPAGPRGERLLQVQVDHWRPASRSALEGTGSRSRDRVQHPEPDDRAWSAGLVRHRTVTIAGPRKIHCSRVHAPTPSRAHGTTSVVTGRRNLAEWSDSTVR